ncbi:MAG: oligosaccharide flippase family protein [Chloroflexi bacterium]|nr:oligosaccharide flippase family protein [Chloroflexota bacterium]
MSDSRAALLRTGLTLAGLRLAGGLAAFAATPIIARRFGLDPALDSFYIASSIPFVLSSIALIGGLETAVPPIFRQLSLTTEATDENGWGFVNALWPPALAGALVAAGVSFVLMPALLPRIAPGLDATRQSVAVSMARALLLAPIIAAPVGVWRGALIAKRKLIGPAALVATGSAVYFAIVALAPATLGAWTLVAATLVAGLTGLAGLLIVFPRALTARLRPTLNLRHPALPAALALLVPLALNELVYHADIVIMRSYASQVSAGTVAAYEFATRPLGTLITLLLAGIVAPAFPELARTARDLPAFRATLDRALKIMIAAALPLAVGLALLSGPVVRLLYERGRFTADDAARVSAALAMLTPYFFLTALAQPLAYATYARQQPLWTLAASAAGLAFSAVGGYFLSQQFGLLGIAMGDGLGAVPLAGVLLWWRWRNMMD